MTMYPLQSLLSVRIYREEGAKNNLARAERALEEAKEMEKKKQQEYNEFCEWRLAEEGRRYDAIMNKVLSMEKLDEFHAGLANLKAQEGKKEEEVFIARKEISRCESEKNNAQTQLKIAKANTAKINAHKDIWTEEEKKETERKEDLELEEFKPVSRRGAEAEE